MVAETKPKTQPVWSSVGAINEPADAKKSLGFIEEIPPHEVFNWVLNNVAKFAAHVNESGIPEWDIITSYDVDALSKASDGTIYVSLTNLNVNNDPVASPSEWALAFVKGTFATQSPIGEQGFLPDDLPMMQLLLNNSAGPYTLRGIGYTNGQLTTIYNTLLANWVADMET